MKIAICFSGQIRTGSECSSNFLNYIGDLITDCDFFVHTWDVETISMNLHVDIGKETNKPFVVDNSVFETFKNIYNPRNMTIDKYDSVLTRNAPGGLRFNQKTNNYVVSLFESVFYANELKKQYEEENNFKYDYVVRCRPDLIFCSSKSLKDDIEQTRDKLFLYGAHKRCFGVERVEDIYWIAKSDEMNCVSNFYEYYANPNNYIGVNRDWQFVLSHYIQKECKCNISCLKNNEFTVYYNHYKDLFGWDTTNVEECIKRCRELP
jgi:hypothetical protein